MAADNINIHLPQPVQKTVTYSYMCADCHTDTIACQPFIPNFAIEKIIQQCWLLMEIVRVRETERIKMWTLK